MSNYLKNLRLPDNWVDFADLLSKTIFALAAGAIAAAVWIYKEAKSTSETALAHQLDAQRTEFTQRLQQLNETLSENADRRQEISLFLDVVPKDVSDPQWQFKTNSLSAYCIEESQLFEPNPRPPLLQMLCQANADRGTELAQKASSAAGSAPSPNVATYIASSEAKAQISALAAVGAADTTPSGGRWYAVVASVPFTNLQVAAELAESLNQKLASVTGTCDVHVFETKISHSFAITSGVQKSEVLAKARVSLIRSSGVVLDAFAQPDRDWTLSTKVAQPISKLRPPC